MPFISVSNVRVEEVEIESFDRELCVIKLKESGGRIRVRRTRLYESREELEEKLGLKRESTGRNPAQYFH